jgi:hypothetical protein
MTISGAKRLIVNCGADIVAGRYIQTPPAMLGHPRRFSESNLSMQEVLDRLSASTQRLAGAA